MTFDSLVLPPNAQGFVKFKIAQKPNNAPGTSIANSATVFLGYDAPKQTATYTHVVGGPSLLDFVLISDVDDPVAPGVEVKAYPNPFAASIEIEVNDSRCNSLVINVFDMKGQLVRQEKALGNHLQLMRNGMPSGCYTFQLEADGRPIHTGKIIVR